MTKKILVVDSADNDVIGDMNIIRQMVVEQLKSLDVELEFVSVASASSLDAILRKMVNKEFDAVITAIEIPTNRAFNVSDAVVGRTLGGLEIIDKAEELRIPVVVQSENIEKDRAMVDSQENHAVAGYVSKVNSDVLGKVLLGAVRMASKAIKTK